MKQTLRNLRIVFIDGAIWSGYSHDGSDEAPFEFSNEAAHLCLANCELRNSCASATRETDCIGTLNSRPHSVQTATTGRWPIHFTTRKSLFDIEQSLSPGMRTLV